MARRLNVGTQWTTPGIRDQLLERGCNSLGWHVGVIPRNVTGCKEGVECGYCGYGCRHGAKNSTARTYLAAAARAGAQLVPNCDVLRIRVEAGRATGIEGVVTGSSGTRHQLTVRAGVVVAACGSINTPALLQRSGLDDDRPSAAACGCIRPPRSPAFSRSGWSRGPAPCRPATPTNSRIWATDTG